MLHTLPVIYENSQDLMVWPSFQASLTASAPHKLGCAKPLDRQVNPLPVKPPTPVQFLPNCSDNSFPSAPASYLLHADCTPLELLFNRFPSAPTSASDSLQHYQLLSRNTYPYLSLHPQAPTNSQSQDVHLQSIRPRCASLPNAAGPRALIIRGIDLPAWQD